MLDDDDREGLLGVWVKHWPALCPTRDQALVQAHFASPISRSQTAPVRLVGLARQLYRAGTAGFAVGICEGAATRVGPVKA